MWNKELESLMHANQYIYLIYSTWHENYCSSLMHANQYIYLMYSTWHENYCSSRMLMNPYITINTCKMAIKAITTFNGSYCSLTITTFKGSYCQRTITIIY